jgi:hypothetical protein
MLTSILDRQLMGGAGALPRLRSLPPARMPGALARAYRSAAPH